MFEEHDEGMLENSINFDDQELESLIIDLDQIKCDEIFYFSASSNSIFEIPKNIQIFTNLKSLNLRENKLKDLKNLSELKSLTSLNIGEI